MSYDAAALGRRIRSLRVGRGWNQSALALEVGFNVGTVSSHERAGRTLDAEQVAAYAQVFDVTVGFLFGESPRARILVPDEEADTYGCESCEKREDVDALTGGFTLDEVYLCGKCSKGLPREASAVPGGAS